jgi:hypothetical protein
MNSARLSFAASGVGALAPCFETSHQEEHFPCQLGRAHGSGCSAVPATKTWGVQIVDFAGSKEEVCCAALRDFRLGARLVHLWSLWVVMPLAVWLHESDETVQPPL